MQRLAFVVAAAPFTAMAQERPARPIRLEPVEVVGTRPDALARIPGSGEVIDPRTILALRPVGAGDVLKRVPGVHVREEEGLGLRPNIGVRGLDPTRSRRVLLLEDGIPVAPAPYGEPSAYYHPPIERMDHVEVLKGSGQILFGPQSVGGVINYVTRQPPLEPGGYADLTAGSREYLRAMAGLGGTWHRTGVLVEAMGRRGQGVREHNGFLVGDATLRVVHATGPSSMLRLKASWYGERLNATYAGLTQAMYQRDRFQNPFAADSFFGARGGVQLTHDYAPTAGFRIVTNVFAHRFARDWWRQRYRAPDTAGAVVELLPANDGRLRDFAVWGAEPRLKADGRALGLAHQVDVGARFMHERMDQRRVEGAAPDARAGTPAEDDTRWADAVAVFAQDRLGFGRRVVVTPGLRIEHVRFRRDVRRWSGAVVGRTGESDLTVLIPGLGASVAAAAGVTLFAGAHRGFAPPRFQDAVDNAGSGMDLDAERSWNYEVGARARLARGVVAELTGFRMDFANQIIASSLAGGAGAGLVNAGRTLHQGMEARLSLEGRLGPARAVRLAAELAWTYVPTAEFSGDRYESGVRITGNRLPYAPRHLLSWAMGFDHRAGVGVRLDGWSVGGQFADPLNTVAPSHDGRRGVLPSHAVWNAGVEWRGARIGLSAFAAIKNLFDVRFIATRAPQGIFPGAPRIVQVGVRQDM